MNTKRLIQSLFLIGTTVVFSPVQAHPNQHDHWPLFGLVGLTLLEHNLSRHHRHEHQRDGRRHHRYRNDPPRQYSYGYQRRHKHNAKRGYKYDRRGR